jgi:hypothetical protein
MEVLELREELAAAKAAGNTAMIESLRAQMATRREAAVRSLTELFERADLAAIKKQLILLRYLERYLDECDAALDED